MTYTRLGATARAIEARQRYDRKQKQQTIKNNLTGVAFIALLLIGV